MLYPISDAWHPTYAWNWPLAEYMPMTACPLLQSKPALILLALWNDRRHLDPLPNDIPCTTRHAIMKVSDADWQKLPDNSWHGQAVLPRPTNDNQSTTTNPSDMQMVAKSTYRDDTLPGQFQIVQ